MTNTDDRVEALYGSDKESSTIGGQTEEDEQNAPPVDIADTSPGESTGENTIDEFGYEKPSESTNPYSLDDEGDVAALNYADTAKVELSDSIDLSLLANGETEVETLKNNLGYIANLTGCEQSQMTALVDSCNTHLMSVDVPDPTVSMQELHREHGASLTEKLNQASTLINSFPDLARWMNETGAGNRLDIIQAVIKISSTERSQHRLQQLLQQQRNK